MFEVGKVCMKIAGRDAGKIAVIIDILDEPYVLVDGEVRRRKCNIKHLEPLERKLEIEKNASHAEVLKALNIKEEKKKVVRKKEKAFRPKKVRQAKSYAEAKKEKKKVEEEVKPKQKEKKSKK